VLTDDDMVSIIEEGAEAWAQEAVASRDSLSPGLAETIIRHGKAPTVAKVIANPRSSLSPPVLETLVDRSETETELQPPLVERKEMSGGLLTKLAKFVALPLLKTLCGRPDLDRKSVGAINGAIETRADKPAVRAAVTKPRRTASAGKASAAKTTDVETPEARARRLFAEGSLTDDTVAVALERWENNFVIEALALRTGYKVAKVRRMVRVKSPRTMVALAWKAGFTARFAMDLQRQLANILPTKVINARDGLDYALSESEMKTQLSLFD